MILKESEFRALSNRRHRSRARYPHLFFNVRGGSSPWQIRYTLNSLPGVDLSLGAYPAMSWKAARLQVIKLNLDMAQGGCPKTCRNGEKQRREREIITFKGLAEPFYETRRRNIDRVYFSVNMSAQPLVR